MASPGLAQICSRYIIDRNFDKAIQELDIFLKANPADSELWNSRGWLLMQEGKHREAIECFEKAKNLDSQNAHALNNEGLANCNLGDYEKAISNFDQALGIDKNYANAWNNKGLAQYYLAA